MDVMGGKAKGPPLSEDRYGIIDSKVWGDDDTDNTFTQPSSPFRVF